MAVSPGDEAPDFKLPDQNRQLVKLSDYRQKQSVVLLFHPFSFTPICEGELCQLRDGRDSLAAQDTAVIAISTDSAAAHKAWADQLGVEYPYLSDFWPHGAVAKAYGVFDDRLGAARRATFFIDRDGIVADSEVNEIPDARGVSTYPERARALQQGQTNA